MTATHRRAIGAAALLFAAIVLFGAVLSAGGGLAAGSSTTQSTLSPQSSAGVTAEGTGDQGPPGPPNIDGDSAILMNMADGRVIFEKDADKRRAVASTTKIMTALLVLENLPFDREVTVSDQAAAVGESGLWLQEGEVLSVQELMYGLLVKSANDAAVALAEETSGSVSEFVGDMNARALELGMQNTHFANPHGLDFEEYNGSEHYSTARDLAVLAAVAMKRAEFRRLVSTVEIVIPWTGHEFDRLLENRNTLLGGTPFITGIKTGYTKKAGYCFVGSGAKEGTSLVSVILGGEDKDAVNEDTVELLKWGFEHYRESTLVEEGLVVARIPLPYRPDEDLPLVTDRKLVRTVFVGDEVETDVRVQEQLTFPVEQGTVLGGMDVRVGGESIGVVDLVASKRIEEPSLRLRLRYWWNRLIGWIGADGVRTAAQPT